jgi:regulator of protease activity HflC (stomatin/prohibitin superfamily)
MDSPSGQGATTTRSDGAMSFAVHAYIPVHDSGKVTIHEYERGLLSRKGAITDVLGPGRYRIWPFSGVHIAVVDVRRNIVQVLNQKMLTADGVTVTLNLSSDHEVSDPRAAMLTVSDWTEHLYADLQLALRNTVVAVTLDQLLVDRGALGEQVRGEVAPRATAYGVTLHSAGIKDVIFSPQVRNLLMKEVEARRLAQAALTSAREEAAAMRSLLNTARLTEAHPHLLRLRELEVARAAVQAGGNTVVLGLQGPTVPIAPGVPARGTPDEADAEE